VSEWWIVLSNSVWILGLSIALAAFSYADWWAMGQRKPLRVALGRPQFGVPLLSGMALTCAGLALCDHRWWAKALWGILAVGLAFEARWLHLARRDAP